MADDKKHEANIDSDQTVLESYSTTVKPIAIPIPVQSQSKLPYSLNVHVEELSLGTSLEEDTEQANSFLDRIEHWTLSSLTSIQEDPNIASTESEETAPEWMVTSPSTGDTSPMREEHSHGARKAHEPRKVVVKVPEPVAKLDGGPSLLPPVRALRPSLYAAKSTSSVGSSLTNLSFDDGGWDEVALLSFTDSIRRALEYSGIPKDDLEMVSVIVSKLLKEERRADCRVELSLIAYTRLDKFLADLIKNGHKLPKNKLLEGTMSEAISLQRNWHQRFKSDYYTIDQLRMTWLQESGGLRCIELNPKYMEDGRRWIVTEKAKCRPDAEGGLTFELGHWWLNMVCAYRDGIVASPTETLTQNKYGVVGLALLSGTEVDGPVKGTVEYKMQGRREDMHFCLMMTQKRPIRILRGHKLTSKYAPRVGVRYDGLYTIQSFGYQTTTEGDEETNAFAITHKCKIVLKRVGGQTSMEDLGEIPMPSQLDDWELYDRILGHEIRARQGDDRYSNWRSWQEALEKEKKRALQENMAMEEIKRFACPRASSGQSSQGTRKEQ